VSLFYLAVRIGTIRGMEAEFDRSIAAACTVRHPEASVVSSSRFERAQALLRAPPTFSTWSNLLTVPETRVWCLNEKCRRPIRMFTARCPFCREEQVTTGHVRPGVDSDADGILDDDERSLGLQPLNADDAAEDLDGDLFSNLVEFRAGTDLRDKRSHPDMEPYLEVEAIEPIPFQFVFKSYMQGVSNVVFALNTRDDGETYFRRLGEEIEGFTVDAFRQVVTQSTSEAWRRTDRSELVLRSGEKRIPLVYGEGVKYVDYQVTFVLRLNDTRMKARVGERFKLPSDVEYEVMDSVDTVGRSAVLRRLPDGKRFTIGRASGGGGASGTGEIPVPPENHQAEREGEDTR
jgi:hypothetical protein